MQKILMSHQLSEKLNLMDQYGWLVCIPQTRLFSLLHCLKIHPFMWIFTAKDQPPQITRLTTTPLEMNEPTEGDDEEEIARKRRKKMEKHMTLVLIFTHEGNYIFTGTSKGWLNIFDTTSSNLNLVRSIKITNSI